MLVIKNNIQVIKISLFLLLFLAFHQVSAQDGTVVLEEEIIEENASSSESFEDHQEVKDAKDEAGDVVELEELIVTEEAEAEKKDVIKQKVEVSPSVIDENFLKSEIGKYSIKLKNNTERKMDIYAMVNNVSAVDGKLEFNTVNSEERAVSAANWILIRRGVIELMPFEEVTVPLEIRVSQNAVPGEYYVAVSFPQGPHRAGAEESMLNDSYAETRLNITIGENAIEKAQIKKFISAKNLYLNKEVYFDYGVENLGNKTIDPHGFIYVTNRNGAEVAKIEIVEGESNLGPGNISEVTKTWSEGVKLGKYKAKLELEYGEKSIRDLQDTIFFWVLPWQSLLLFFALVVVLVALLTFIIFKKTYHKG